MTENKRYTLKEIDNFNYGIKVTDVIMDNDIELPQSTVCDLLNEKEETINNLKKALWESQMSYIEEKNEYSNDVEMDIGWLKKEFEREYWNGDVE